MLADMISENLKTMCGYARSVIGSGNAAENAVEGVLTAVTDAVADGYDLVTDKVELYRLLDTEVMSRAVISLQGRKLLPPLDRMSVDERRATFLSQCAGFRSRQVGAVLSMPVEKVESLIRSATKGLEDANRMGVLVIEDEPHIAKLLSGLVVQAGHWVAGVAQTHMEAVDLAMSSEFGMIISDVMLSEGSLGTEAVAEISCLRGRTVPTLFVTAYPRLVESKIGDATSFLIKKPFEIGNVREVIGHAAWCAKAA